MNNIDSWNPMATHYASEENTYDTGAGAKLPEEYQPSNLSQKHGPRNPLKLYVANLPERLSEESLENIFSSCGTVKDVWINPSTRYWALVTYENASAATRAVCELNNHSDYKFKVSYYREKPDTQYSRIQQSKQNDLNRIQTSRPTDRSNKVNHRDSFSVQNGSRPLSNSFSSNVPVPVNTARTTQTINSIRKPSTMSIMEPIPFCQACGKRTLEQCTNCKVYYCSKKCMVLGYEHHTDNCITIVPHSSDLSHKALLNEIRPAILPLMNNMMSEQTWRSQWEKDCHDYRQYKAKNCPNRSNFPLNISNSYDNDEQANRSYQEMNGVASKVDYSDAGDSTDGIMNREQISPLRGKENRPNKRDYDNDASRHVDRSENSTCSEDGVRRKREDRGQGKNDNGYTSDFRGYNDKNIRFGPLPPKDSRESRKSVDQNRKSEKNFDDAISSARVPNKSQDGRNDFGKQYCENGVLKAENSNRRQDSGDEMYKKNNSHDDIPASVRHESSPQMNNKLRTEPAYKTNRKSYAVGDKMKVRLNELTSDVPGYSSVRIIEEEPLLQMLLADLMEENNLPAPILKVAHKCLVCLDDKRIRGSIVSEEPLKVKFVDTGFKGQICETKIIQGMPQKYATVRPFAYKVKFIGADPDDLEKYLRLNKMFELVIKVKHKELVWEVQIVTSEFNERLHEARQLRDAKASQTTNSTRSSESPSKETEISAKKSDESPSKEARIPAKVECASQFKKLILAKDVPVQLMVTYIEDDLKTFYVARLEELQKLMEAITKLKPDTKLENVPEDKIVEGHVCLALWEGIWYRARIVSKDPIKVLFVDFGNVEEVKAKDLKELDSLHLNALDPFQAVQVYLDEGTTTKHEIVEQGEHIIKPIRADVKKKCWVVVVEHHLEVLVTIALSKKEYYVMKKCDDDKQNVIDGLPKTPLKSEPKIGSLYLCQYGDFWSRVELISVSPPTVKYIDFGNDEKVELGDLRELPDSWKTIDPLAFKITLAPEPAEQIEEYQCIRIKPKDNNCWEILVDRPSS